MSQSVMITSDTPVALKPLIESAIRSELQMLELGLARTRQRLKDFEDHYSLSSEEFFRRFETAEVEETLDFIEWAGEVKTYRQLENQRRTLEDIQLS